jgi:hypothetical protein
MRWIVIVNVIHIHGWLCNPFWHSDWITFNKFYGKFFGRIFYVLFELFLTNLLNDYWLEIDRMLTVWEIRIPQKKGVINTATSLWYIVIISRNSSTIKNNKLLIFNPHYVIKSAFLCSFFLPMNMKVLNKFIIVVKTL